MNAIVAEKDASEVVDFRAPGPGERLRNARVARDMDLSKMAEELHLTADMVEALECDDYSELPARVFVRGYVRNYARLVELPLDSVLKQFDELWPEDTASVKIDRAPRLPADSRPGSRWSGIITWILLLAAVGLFLMWWQGYLDRFTHVGREAVSPQMDSTLSVEPQQAPSGLQLPSERNTSEQPNVLQPVDQQPGMLALPPVSVVDVPKEEGQHVAIEPESVAGEQSAPKIESLDGIAAALEQSELTEEQIRAEAANAAAPAEPGIADTGVLVRFTEDCWVDIRGANRSFKLFGTMKKGTEKRLEGEAPYKFVVGKASAVEVLVDGKPFDLAPHTKDNVARFSLSP